jgi:anti-anti-sigma factor
MTVKVTVYPGDPVVWYDCATCHSKSVLTRYDEPWWPTSPPVGVSMPIDVRIIGDDVILSCRSDSNAFRALAEAIQSEAGQGRYGRFVLDLQGINEIDSQGLSELLRAYMTVRRQGGAMTVMNLTPRLEEVLARLKLLAFFEGTEGDDPHTIGVAMPLPDSEPD